MGNVFLIIILLIYVYHGLPVVKLAARIMQFDDHFRLKEESFIYHNSLQFSPFQLRSLQRNGRTSITKEVQASYLPVDYSPCRKQSTLHISVM